MIAGLSGSLLSHDALPAAVPAASDDQCAAARRRLRAWHAALTAEMGPACSARAVFDRVAAPLTAALGFRITLFGGDGARLFTAVLEADGRPAAALLVTEWGRDPAGAWRDGVRHGIGSSVRWCFCVTGPVLRVLDARRTYSRRFVEFELDTTIRDASSFAVFWELLRAAAFPPGERPLLDRAVALSEQYRSEVRATLQLGVQDALTCLIRAFAGARRRRAAPAIDALFDESLIVIYRVLFLLFAEARGLVPKWHPIYRGSYTIESLRAPVEMLPRPRGLWASLQAIARLAHRGCHAGTLRVPPFNGRLFSPAHAPLAESLALDDGAVRQALLALTTQPGRSGRRQIAYADLGVEQLGGVYERILDFEPAGANSDPAALTLVRAGRRKVTGAFYTPRALTEYLVRRTLAPLVGGADPSRVLSLRVLDPAMGSGAFLVAACRYLALEYESALIREGSVAAGDLSEQDRSGFRRAVAQRCLFGVDINPMAVQLGRLSLWLATLAADRPLTFLDHHLRAGNSLVGASLADLARQPAGTRPSQSRAARLPLFEAGDADTAIGATIERRLSMTHEPGDTIDQVRAKERTMASLLHESAPLARWKAAADLWCSGWFQDDSRVTARAGRATFGALVDQLLGRDAVLPDHVAAPLLEAARRIADGGRFFHWTLEFPEVFHDSDGRPGANAGFDAVIGNPPWEMLRGDRGDSGDAARLTGFARGSGVYLLQGGGHVNLYQLFLERALALTRPGGRLGLVLPSGFGSDHGCAALRRHVLDRTAVDTFISVENRGGLFPIHRSLKFLLVTATSRSSTAMLPCRFGIRSPDALDELADSGADPSIVPIPRSLIEQLTGDQLAIPELRSPADAAIVSRIACSTPALGDPAGWNAAFGRELNATDDRRHFLDARSRRRGRRYPVIEGKQIQPFAVDVTGARLHIPAGAAAVLLDPARTYGRARLAYRDVASATNRVTLVAAIVPAHVVTTHTLFCLKGSVDDEVQRFLCGVFNSFVANYLVRVRVGTHVTVSIIERLPVPRPPRDSAAFRDVAALALRLSVSPGDRSAAARLQAAVARLYGCTAPEFQHVLSTFPLVAAEDRDMAMDIFRGAPDHERSGTVPHSQQRPDAGN
jgi:hypothetical protein